jgi:hypothetical protein
MKKIGYVLLGLGVSILLYLPFLYLIPLAIRRTPGKHYSLIAFMIILPVCLIIGSLLSGYLIQPHMKQRSFFRYLLISPGVYLSLAGLVTLLVSLAPLLTQPGKIQSVGYIIYLVIIYLVIIFLEWIVTSFIGTRIGIFLKDRRIRQSNKPASGEPSVTPSKS